MKDLFMNSLTRHAASEKLATRESVPVGSRASLTRRLLCRGFVADRCDPSYHKSSSSLSTSICGASAATLLSSFLRVTNAISAE